jgi:uncharacterized membrane protein
MHGVSHLWCRSDFFLYNPWGMIFSLLFWVLVVFAGVTLIRSLPGRSQNSSVTGMDRVEQRYVRGEIDEEMYLKMKQEAGSGK